jgi:DNA polymerase-3 subunit epsilon
MIRTDEVVAFDVETTGLSPHRGHRVIEIGAVRVLNGKFGEEFHSLIDCGGRISMSAQRIHGITPAMLRGQLPIDSRRHRALEDARLVARLWLAMEE